MTSDQTPAWSRKLPRRRKHPRLALAVIVIAVLAGCTSAAHPRPGPSISIASRSIPPAPPSCAVSSILVNSCRPWLGAAAKGNPGAPKNRIEQFYYLEKLIGHHLDIFRDYDTPPGSGPDGTLPLNRYERYFVKQPGTYVDVNWRPANTWAQADGGDASVNTEIKKVADNIKAVAPHKIFLTVWWEPQDSVSGGTSCSGLAGRHHGGTPAQYRQMWRNVESIFKAQGAHNVVWTMDYMSYPKFDCLVPQLWPGNDLVDWVIYDSYDHDNKFGTNWSDTVGRFYHLLQRDSSSSVDFDAKPWGLGEFGTCKNKSAINAQQYFEQAKQAIHSNIYPKLKMFIIFADKVNNSGGYTSCLTDYSPNGRPDPGKNAAFKSLVNSPVFNR